MSTKHRPPHMKLIYLHNKATESSYFRVIVAIGTAKAHRQYANDRITHAQSHVILACFRVLFDSVHRLYHVCICNGEPSHSYANAVKSMTICSSVANLKIKTTIHARRSRLPGHNVYTAHSPSPFMHAHNIMNIENQ
ncbi:hypothetical protein VNO77_28116 [Canavalia gladiata]|uniref:Uncharacterized protein n=1 Tax=Canavalia gladiata TaxID=3824 RepID=A0AAN9KWF4_CANGL